MLNKLEKYLNQLLILNIPKLCFSEILNKNAPIERSNFSCVKYKDESGNFSLIIHGGINHNEILNDTYTLNLKNFTWEKIETIGENPVSSTEHTADIYNEFMIVIGGEINEDLHDKIRILNLKSSTWKTFSPPLNYENIFMRIFHSSAIIDSKIIIFSGCNSNYFCFNDIIEIELKNFDFEKNLRIENIEVIDYNQNNYENEYLNSLKKQKSNASIYERNTRYPYPRWGANLLVKNSNCLVLFGGRNKKDFNDLWIYSIFQKKWFEVKNESKIYILIFIKFFILFYIFILIRYFFLGDK